MKPLILSSLCAAFLLSGCVVHHHHHHPAPEAAGHEAPRAEEPGSQRDAPQAREQAPRAGRAYDFFDRYSLVSRATGGGCEIDENDALSCWGATPEGTPRGSFMQVDMGSMHACALTTEGRALCWGNNEDGQLDAPSDRFVEVRAEGRMSCGLRDDGAIRCWGSNDSGQTSPPRGQFTAIAVDTVHGCGIRADGDIQCWGYYDDLVPGPFVSVGVGVAHSCGLREDGRIHCWGSNTFSKLEHPSGRFEQLHVGSGTSCAVDDRGIAQCWGWGFEPAARLPDPVEAVLVRGDRLCHVFSDAIECEPIAPEYHR